MKVIAPVAQFSAVPVVAFGQTLAWHAKTAAAALGTRPSVFSAVKIVFLSDTERMVTAMVKPTVAGVAPWRAVFVFQLVEES